jgi:hypothetical protein
VCALFESLLLVSEADVDEPYAQVFAGEHPLRERIDGFRAVTLSWLWRLHHGSWVGSSSTAADD